jgi:hypothetical protein
LAVEADFPLAKEAMKNTASDKVIAALSKAALDEIVCDAETVTDLVDFDQDEEMEWIACTYTHAELVNVFHCVCAGAADAFVASYHSDGGVISGAAGPYASFDDVATEIPTDEGWTMV